MKAEIALLALTITAVAAFGLFVSSLVYAEQQTTGPFTLLSASAAQAPSAFVLKAQFYGGGRWSRGGIGDDGNRKHFGLSPYHGTYLPWFYDDEGHYGASKSACDWNGYEYICNWASGYDY